MYAFLSLCFFTLVSPVWSQNPEPVSKQKKEVPKAWIVQFRGAVDPLTELREGIQKAREGKLSLSALEARFRRAERVARVKRDGFALQAEALGAELREVFWLVPAASISATPSQVAILRKRKDVAAIYEDSLRAASRILVSTNAKNHAVDALQKAGIKGKGVTVAIVDSGLDMKMGTSGRPHATFYVNGNPKNTTGGGIQGSRVLAMVQMGKQPPEDAIDHGTPVAGVAAGEKWNNKANSDRGHAPLASIVGYSIADTTNGLALLTTMVKAWQQVLRDAAKYKIRVANMSYQGTANSTSIEQQAMDRTAELGDIFISVSAGNAGTNYAVWAHGATNILAVGAVQPNTRVVAPFSSRGPVRGDPKPKLRNYPHIMANGVSMVMPRMDLEQGEKVANGASYAAPQVCGAAALYRSLRKGATAVETRSALLATTEDIGGKNRNKPYNDINAYGFGYLRDDRLVALAQGGLSGLILNTRLLSQTKPIAIPYQVQAGKFYAVVLAWNRLNTNRAVWSNLDLEVYLGKTLLASSKSPSNLHEKVVFKAPVTGTVTLLVTVPFLEAPKVPVALVGCESLPPFIQGEWKTFGVSCQNAIGGKPFLMLESVPFVGRSYFLRLSLADPNSAVAMVLGFSNKRFGLLTLPIDLSPLGAKGCFLYTSLDQISLFSTDNSGTARQKIQVPLLKSIVGIRYFHQAFVFSSKANKFGFVFTNGVAIRMGGDA